MDSTKNSNEPLPLATTSTYAAGVTLGAAFRLLKRFTDACLDEYDLTTSQWFIIGTVSATGSSGIRITELATILDTTLSFLTNSVNKLEAKGFLVRREDQNDSRSKSIYLADGMEDQVAQIEAQLRYKMHEGLYASIDREDLQTYLRVLHQISQLQITFDRS